jgi:predicted dehydrogenase
MSRTQFVIRVGVVGCGRVAQQRHLPIIASLPDTKLVAVSDVDAETRKKVAERYGVSQVYEDYRKLVASEVVDAVMVATPTQFHAEVGIAALRAGKHVMIEKPLALSLDEVDQLEAAALESRKAVAVAMNSRWHRLIREARDIVLDGALGRIGLLRSAFTDGFRHNEQPRAWMMRHDLAGSVLVEQAVHHFDLWQFLLDSEVKDISAKMQEPMTLNECAVVTATMRNGVIVSAMFSEGLKDTNELEIYGHEGRLRVAMYDFDGLDVTPRSEYPGSMSTRVRRFKQALVAFPGAVKRTRTGGDWEDSYRREWRHFLECIRGGKQPECGLREGRRALQVGLAAMASLSHGAPVRVADAPRGIIVYTG